MTEERSPLPSYADPADLSTVQNRINLTCPRCGAVVPDAPFCCQCGRSLQRKVTRKRRGNGQGTVVMRDGKYKAVVTLGYWTDSEGKLHRRTRSQTFDRKKDAVAALAALRAQKSAPSSISLKEAFDRWSPTHKATASTMGCYSAAFQFFKSLWHMDLRSITIDDLQDCIDECGRGRRTMENMRAVVGLVYKYCIPRQLADLNLAQYLKIDADPSDHRPGFTEDEIEMIRDSVGKVDGADLILCMIYTGFRPSEFLALTGDSYDREKQTLTGGSKTDAGRGRIVTISPKIAHLIPCVDAGAPLFGHAENLKTFTEKTFYPVLSACGVNNPKVEVGGGIIRHKYTPHSCRHTFATLMKAASGADKDKLQLIGHASSEMLRYYQDVGIDDLRKITDQI